MSWIVRMDGAVERNSFEVLVDDRAEMWRDVHRQIDLAVHSAATRTASSGIGRRRRS
jgi:hypothetical protein